MKRLLRLTIYNASHMADLQKYVEKVSQMYFYKNEKYQESKEFRLKIRWPCAFILPDAAQKGSLCLFTVPDTDPDTDSDSNCKPNGYIILCRTFRNARSEVQIPIPTSQYRNGIGIWICECL